MKAEYEFDLKDLDSQLASFAQKGITEFALHDKNLSCDKKSLCEFLAKAQKYIPDVYISIPVDAKVIDGEVISLCRELFCSLDIFFYAPLEKDVRFDKKLFSKKAALLNNAELVFGFLADFAISPFDSIKSFRERIDFAMSLYPNHVEFSQLYSDEREEKCTATFSSQDINYVRNLAFAIEVFYSQGRAVSWFNSILKPLKIPASKFFSDFAEWQRCNNCAIDMRKKIRALSQKEIEKMQLLFLEEKFEEKKIEHLFPVVYDIVRINGAFSRLQGEGEECTIELSFNPDDLLSHVALDINAFAENVCLEECKVRIFAGKDGIEYKLVNN